MSAARTIGRPTDDPAAFSARGAPAHGAPLRVLSPADVMAFVARNARLIAAIMLAVLLFGLLFALLSPARYRSSAQLLIDPRGLQILKNEITKQGDSTDGNLIDIENQRYVLLSRSVLQSVVEREKLDENPMFGGAQPGLLRRLADSLGLGGARRPDPRARAVMALAESVEVVRGERAYVLEVAVTTRDPDLSARLANVIAQVYVDKQNEARSQAARRASDALTDRANELRREVQQAEEKVERYRAGRDLTLGPNGRLIGEQQIGDLSYQLGLARARVAEAQARLDAVERVRRAGLNPGATTEAISSPAIAALRGQYAQATQQEAALASQLGPRHPALIQAQAQTRDLRRQIMSELDRIAGAARTDLARARATEAALDKRVGEVRAANDKSSVSMVELRDLERAAETSRAVYQAFLTRAKELDESQGIDTTNARVISSAIPALRPSGPPAWLTLAGALMFGAVAGLGAAWLRDRLSGAIHAPEDASEESGLPVLAVFRTTVPPGGWKYLFRPRPEGAQLVADRASLSALVERLRLGRSDGARAVALVGPHGAREQTQLAAALAEFIRWDGLDVALVDAAGVPRAELATAFADEERGQTPGRLRGLVRVTPFADLAGAGARDLERRMKRLMDDNDIALFDAPASLDEAAPSALIDAADAIVFVFPAARLAQRTIDATLDRLAGYEDKFAGLVFIGAGAATPAP